MASGVRILFNLNRCRGPLTAEKGIEEQVRSAVRRSGVTVLALHFVPFPNGTMNVSGDLSESHFGLGTYKADRYVAGEINMCHETYDNTDLAQNLMEKLRALFDPQDFRPEEDIQILPWQSR